MPDSNSTPKGCVYQARNKLNGKSYIGKTNRILRLRKSGHFATVNAGSRCCFAGALRKYGREMFEWTILFCSDDAAELSRMERHFIRELNTKVPFGYNRTDGGDGAPGTAVSAETRAKMSVWQKGKRKFSDEHKARISDANKGRVITPEMRAKISAAHKGRPNLARRGVPLTADQRARISALQKGRRLTKEHRQHIARSLKGRIISEQHRQKLRKPKPPRTAEHAAKIAAKTRGRKQSTEALAKIVEANRKHNSDPTIRAKISKALLGKKHGPMSQEQKDKLRLIFKGKKKPPRSPEHRANIAAARRGKKHSEATKAKIRTTKARKRAAKGEDDSCLHDRVLSRMERA
ncbi:MAG: NUMOD3 domain-containing DNA-binding protein [Thermoguttaceae bacterium]